MVAKYGDLYNTDASIGILYIIMLSDLKLYTTCECPVHREIELWIRDIGLLALYSRKSRGRNKNGVPDELTWPPIARARPRRPRRFIIIPTVYCFRSNSVEIEIPYQTTVIALWHTHNIWPPLYNYCVQHCALHVIIIDVIIIDYAQSAFATMCPKSN